MFVQQTILFGTEKWLKNQKFAIFGGSLDNFGRKYEKKTLFWTDYKEDRVDYAEGMEQSIRIKEPPI